MRSISPSPPAKRWPCSDAAAVGKAPWRGCWWVWKHRSTAILHGAARRWPPWKGEAIGAFRRDIQLVFQDAFSAVNPRKTVREIVSEPLRHLLCLSREARARRVEEMLLAVDLASSLLDKPGAAQRRTAAACVCLARALAVRAAAVDPDEAVSNLDLLLQAEIIALLKRLQAQFDTACLFITHDLRLVERFASESAGDGARAHRRNRNG